MDFTEKAFEEMLEGLKQTGEKLVLHPTCAIWTNHNLAFLGYKIKGGRKMGQYPEGELDYARDLTIDQYHLELEWLQQANLMMKYSEAYAQAIFDNNRAKEALDATRAQLDAEIRQDLANKGAKFTEAVVDGQIKMNSEYSLAMEQFHKTSYAVSLLQGAVAAFQARKTALENLVKLFGMQYYAEPYEPPEGKTTSTALSQGKLQQSTALKKVVSKRNK